MPVDFGILAQTPSIGARYAEGMQMRQADAERNMLRQSQMQQMAAQQENMAAQRAERLAMAADREEQARARRAAAVRQAEADEYLGKVSALFEQNNTPLNLKTAQQGLAFAVKSRDPSAIQMMTKTVQALQEKEDYAAEATRLGLPGAAPAPAATPSVMRQPAAAAPAAPTNMLAGTPFDIGVGAPAPANALAAPPAAAPAGVTREMAQQMILSTNPRIREQGKALVATLEKPQTYTPSPDMQGYELAKSEGYKGTFFDYQRQLAEAKRPPPQPREPKEPNKPVEVVGPDGRPIIVSAEEAISKRMTPAKAMEGLAPKEIQKREAEYPKATASFKNFVAKSEQYIKELEKLRDDPGLDSITGTIYGVTPGVISGPEGRRAKAQYDKVFAKGGFQALQDLKAMSPAGGALGNVSNEEGRRLEASVVGGLDRSQQLTDVKQGINDYITEIRGSMKRVGDAYGDTYEYRTSRGGAPVAPAGLSPEDKQALDWANSNPKDPRAAQIKKRLGM